MKPFFHKESSLKLWHKKYIGMPCNVNHTMEWPLQPNQGSSFAHIFDVWLKPFFMFVKAKFGPS
jgi:hypothetical protein